MTHRLDEIKAKEETWTSLESAIVFADSHGSVNLAYRAAQDLENMEYEIKTQAAELLKLREELYEVKKALYMAQICNTMTLGAGNGAWTFGSTLYNRIERVLSGFRPHAD